jgi:hypothetical protein
MDPVLYLHPSLEASGHLVYSLRKHQLLLTKSVVFSRDPACVVRDLVESPLYLPVGMGGSVPEEDYSRRLRGVLVPLLDSPMQVVRHDPVTGLPDVAFNCGLVRASDGTLVMEVLTPPCEALPPVALLDDPPWYSPPVAPRQPLADAPGGLGFGASVPERGAGVDVASTADPAVTRADLQQKAHFLLRPENGDVALVYKLDSQKSGASGARFQAYCTEICVREYRAAQSSHAATLAPPGNSKCWVHQDLRWDLAHGIVTAFFPPAVVPDAPLRVFHIDDRRMDDLLDLESLEPSIPGQPESEPSFPEMSRAPYTERYLRGRDVLRVSLEADYGTMVPDLGGGYDPDGYAPAADVIMSVGAAVLGSLSSGAPASVREAMAHPAYLAPFGWRAAMQKEILRVEKFGAMVMVPASVVRSALRDHHDRTTVAFLVAIFAEKKTPSGDPRQPEIVHKFRIAYADSQGVGPDVLTFSSCVDGLTNIVITAVTPALGAHQTSIDVGGAYYHGTPPSLAEGGRLVFAHMPYWLPGLGANGYSLRGPGGERMYLQITGNMPGRCDAGRIWQTRLDRFLLGFGMRRLNTDMRVFTWNSPFGALIVHDHVDDTRITTTSAEARRMFTTAWALEFNEPLPSEELSEDFTGLCHHVLSTTRTEISCAGVIMRLVPILARHPPLAYVVECPLPSDAVRVLRAQESLDYGGFVGEVLAEEHLKEGQQILGTVGFAATSCRPDVCFAYHLLSRYVCPLRYTTLVRKYLLRVAHYLVETIALKLTIDTPPLTAMVAAGRPQSSGATSSLDLF